MPAQPIPVPRPRAAAASLALAVFLLLSALFAAAAAAAPPAYKGASDSGEVVFFESEEQLVTGDTDNKRDVYARSFDASAGDEGAYVTREVSTGPTGGNDAYDAFFEEASADGKIAFFSTEEPLTAGDTDRKTDVYARFTASGTTKLVSSGAGAGACLPACGNGGFDTGFTATAADGGEVFLVTAERLDPLADGDSSIDVYGHELPDGPTRLVSAGNSTCQLGCEFVATLRGVSTDGSKAFFASSEPLVTGDDDQAIDIYARALPSGPTSLVSPGDPGCAPCGNGNDAAIFAASSSDGETLFFASREKLVASDDDGANDIYRHAGGVTSLVSAGTENKPASFVAAPGNGSRAFFVTAEALAGGADTNGATDVYAWHGGAPQLITSGKCCGSTFAAVTADAGTVFFTTTQALALGEDGDGSADIYAQDVAGGAPVLVSAKDPSCAACGDGSTGVEFNRASTDGTRVLFTSAEQLSSEDFDNDDDIYVRVVGDGETALATPASGPCPTSDCHATFVGASDDSEHVFFQTSEMVLGEDPDSEPDIYERDDAGLGGPATRLVSTGNSAGLELGPPPPDLEETVPGPSGTSTQPLIVGLAEPDSSIKIYRNASCSGEPIATGTAAELADPGIAATVAAGSTTGFWATAEADGFTSLCSNSVTYTQESVGPPPPPPPPPPSDGSGSSDSSAAAAPAVGAAAEPAKTRDGVAYVAPLTRITFGPAAKTRYPRPVFRFADSTGQPGTRFSCRLDRGGWRPCGSPTKVARLKPGRHVFRVKAINAVGTPETRPASRSFKVVAR